jgi:glycosyltransferase involved in cell wall biosynthesis
MSTLPSPLVSVIIPAYKHEQYVEQALQSVYDQDYLNIELIVLNDKSPDRTGEVISDYITRRDVKARFQTICYMDNEQNLGAHQTINRGIHASHGAYVNILNSDDVFAAKRISTLLRACIDQHAEFAFSGVEVLINDPSLALKDFEYFYTIQDMIRLFPTVGYALLRNQCAISTGNFFFSQRVFTKVGTFRDLKYLHDWDFILRSVLITEPIFVPEPLYYYRLHPGNSFLQLQSIAVRETEAVLRNYFFLCRNRTVENPLAPSPHWGAFFSAFVQESHYRSYLEKP